MFSGNQDLQSSLAACNVEDQGRRMEFCERFLIIHEADARFTEKMPWTDEATFDTNGIVHRDNCVY